MREDICFNRQPSSDQCTRFALFRMCLEESIPWGVHTSVGETPTERMESVQRCNLVEHVTLSNPSFLWLPFDIQQRIFWYAICDPDSQGRGVSLSSVQAAGPRVTSFNFWRAFLPFGVSGRGRGRFETMIYSLFYDTTRFTFRLDLAQSFDPEIFIQPFDEALGADPVITLTIVFVNTEAARLSSIISFVVALARSPRRVQYVHRARVIYPIPHESQPLERSHRDARPAKRTKMSDI